MSSLATYLIAEQHKQSLSATQLAAQLGLSEQQWHALCRSNESWPATVLARVLVRFPDALPLATAEVQRRLTPGDGWRHWHPAPADTLQAA